MTSRPTSPASVLLLLRGHFTLHEVLQPPVPSPPTGIHIFVPVVHVDGSCSFCQPHVLQVGSLTLLSLFMFHVCEFLESRTSPGHLA